MLTTFHVDDPLLKTLATEDAKEDTSSGQMNDSGSDIEGIEAEDVKPGIMGIDYEPSNKRLKRLKVSDRQCTLVSD